MTSMRRPGRAPATVNLGIALAVLAVLLPLLLNAATSAPPAAAEFSPDAQQVIKKAPEGQAAEVSGTGEGAAPGGTAGTGGASPTPPPPTPAPSPSLQVPKDQLKRCVGPPPLRQIEDPQSPPCIAFWQGDNGGATAKGVTRDVIHVAVPTPDGFQKQYEALERFFNTRFQFYGRKISFQYCTPSNGDANSPGSGDETRQTADAANAAAGCGNNVPPFATTFYQFDNGRYYNEQMACRHQTVTVASYTPFDRTYMDRCAPYLYQYTMVADELFGQLGEWACARLAGRPARWAGPALRGTTRAFGIFLAPFYADDPVARESALRPITDRLRACGAEVPRERIIINPVSQTQPGQAADPVSANNAVAQMKAAGVTSVLCLCGVFPFGALTRAASTNDYQPEWIGSTFGILDNNAGLLLSAAPADQLQRLFGLTIIPRRVHPLLEPYNAALQEGDPTLEAATASGDASNFTQIYRPLLLLASGIQMAGPRLTPATFREGLRRTQFPNPVTRLQAGAVGLPRDGVSFTRDAGEWWWSNTARGPYSDDGATGKGSTCYVGGGVRYRSGAWPRDEPALFGSTCDSGR